MGLMPIDKMWERVEIARQDSDTSLFLSLLYCGELIVKLTVAGMVAAIKDDRERHRYRQLYHLVRADGIGDWALAIDEILTGTTSQHLLEQARDEQRELTMKSAPGTWQYEAASLMHGYISAVEPTYEKLPTKVDSRRWLSMFAMLRNKTRGHGAPPSHLYTQICPSLEKSIRVFVDGFCLFRRPWAYLHRNLSGKYRVTKLTQPAVQFDVFKSNPANLPDGVYVYFDQPTRTDLVHSSVDVLDFLLPNGAFTEKTFELISYITSNKIGADATPYLPPATSLPPSETQGVGTLDVQGKSFGNLPPVQKGYIRRKGLEADLFNIVMDDRHPIVTLVGRGGIGKTWLTLAVLHEVAAQERFTALLWFSARDIDLIPQGPKLVTPHVLTTSDIADEYICLTQPSAAQDKRFDSVKYLAEAMTRSEVGPILFVFDNFETVRHPGELFTWIDTYIRLPNKVLITTRIREFKGDYPIEVLGMTEQESDELIKATASTLGVAHLLTEDYQRELYQESGGHPYVIKVLLGEVAKAGKLARVERIVASIDDILDALFERTFSGLSPAAKRVFLTLCSWRSTVPVLALEAVMLRPSNERMDVAGAVEELNRSSFVETVTSNQDNELFLSVPLVAAVFGKRKLATSPMKSAIEADVQLLHAFGAAQQSDVKRGVNPRVEKLFRYVADRVSAGKDQLDGHLPMLEFIARKHPLAWLLLAQLYQEVDWARNVEKAKDAIRRYLESTDRDYSLQEEAWQRLAALCQQTTDWAGEIRALVEMCQLPDTPFGVVSNSVNRINALFSEQYLVLDSEEKRIVSKRLAEIMENRISEGDATDCSRLAWLYIRLRDEEKARRVVNLGLSLELDNQFCKSLASRLSE